MALAEESTFLEIVGKTRDRRCEELLASAEAQAREILKAARHDARLRVARAIAINRQRQHLELGAARAELSTRLREVQQNVQREWLESAWPRVLSALERSWRDPNSRQRWIAAAIECGRMVLSLGERWELDYPADLDPSEVSAATSGIDPPPRAMPSNHIECGLRIRASGATLDGTLHGLLSNRAMIEGRLLAALEAGPP